MKTRINKILGAIVIVSMFSAISFSTMVSGTGGDNPLAIYLTWEGNGGVVVDVYPTIAQVNPGGNFTISGIPNGSSIVCAYLYVGSWEYFPHTASATFAGNSLGNVTQFANDPGTGGPIGSSWDLCAWRWDVTSFVWGNGVYPFSTFNVSRHYGSALVVIYSNPLEPHRQIFINDGAESLHSSTSTTEFFGVIQGTGTLIVFTQADDYSGLNESILFNNVTILGPGNIFNSTSGPFASLIYSPVNTTQGTNTASITTDLDWFGWHLAILCVQSDVLDASIDIDPDTINLKSKGKWITAYITLDSPYDVKDIDIGTVLLENTIPAEWGDVQGTTLMVKFDRKEVQDFIGGPNEDVDLTVKGELNDGTEFEGSDTIRVINPP
ncbi:MAG: DUF3344 domain-containing protein [Thermoplasmata archaeon]|nr:MAG: DUF3344 domain-containing protein [Thermoplasmata archaeon]